MQLESTSFKKDQTIPTRNSFEAANLSPELHWKDVPQKTQAYALIVDDPDAPGKTWVHWVMYNIPASTQALPEGGPDEETSLLGIRQGQNDFQKMGYGGPCPPQGHGPHRYYFKLYALDTMLDLGPMASKVDLEQAMKGHILAQAELMGRFERP